MRVNRSTTRRTSTRRGLRPDRHVYRTMRLNRIRPRTPMFWVQLVLVIAAVIGVVLLVRWAIR
jgi:hypothetical protein